eukprot:SAG22_NODE_7693_length_716_cov_3.901135_1_plen_96_part_00
MKFCARPLGLPTSVGNPIGCSERRKVVMAASAGVRIQKGASGTPKKAPFREHSPADAPFAQIRTGRIKVQNFKMVRFDPKKSSEKVSMKPIGIGW